MTNPVRVLVIEDEVLIGLLVQDMLAELGFRCVGPVATLEQALATIPTVEIDAALLDLNLKGIKAFPVAEALRRRSIPFIFTTGYGRTELPYQWQDIVTLQKPFSAPELRHALEAIKGDNRKGRAD
jgi:DNA-binding response OmpR family regulator